MYNNTSTYIYRLINPLISKVFNSKYSGLSLNKLFVKIVDKEYDIIMSKSILIFLYVSILI